jgi:hypothetical protein
MAERLSALGVGRPLSQKDLWYSYLLVLSGRQGQTRLEKICYKILDFHGGDYEEWCLLGCYAV